jgi:hypothetical protein
MKCGVVEEVDEFCNEHDYECCYMALRSQMFNSAAIRKIEAKR